jgi:Polyketide cyclase / dehydrase and lipid transport
MSTYAHTVEIGRPPEEVFAFVTDPAAYPRWQPSLVRVEPHRPGPLRLGSDATEVRRFTWTVETWWAAALLGGPLAGLATKRELAANAGRLKALLEEARAACPNE